MNSIKHYFSSPIKQLTNTNIWSISQLSLSSVILGLSLSLSGCGGSETSNDAEATMSEQLPDETGQVMIVIRDDEEDFLSYDIDVLSIDLVKENGTRVSVSPSTARVDFIQYTDLSELFSINAVPSGRYNQISFTLDYTSANIIIQDDTGESYQASTQDSEGKAITTFPLTLMLDDESPLVITKGQMSAITLDLDLASSNQIISFDPAIVQVEPFVNVSLDTEADREHRARGLLQTVDSENNHLTLAVKPLRKRAGEFGEITIKVNESTLYEIDGVEVANSDGLASLTNLAIDSPLLAFGSVVSVDAEQVYTATKILAGTSVAWAGQDIFRGVITARTADNITISGVVLAPEDRQAVHSKDLLLSYNEATQFTGFDQQTLWAQSLSVGQRIKALGSFDDEQTFNSEDNIIHIKLSQLTGQVVQLSPLVIDITKLNRRPADSYNFSGTGLTTEQDAEPNHYEIASNNLTIAELAPQDWLTVRGFVSDFAQAPEDFQARSLIKQDIEQLMVSFKATWPTATASFTVDSDSNQINWDQSQARQKMHVRGIPNNLADDQLVQAINSDAEHGRFAIKERDVGIRYFAVYADFANAINQDLTDGKLVKQITSKGVYDEAMQGIKAVAVSVILQ